ncbi:FAD linked oxidase domain-containing protein [Paraburkholderia piptadeniae]|uniref:FAD linked oxidase domain-containing protein n=1 Tax=Paraburkholderia piptadeniae TaxID=1701573 RepID=A0A1N7RR69_9BURK|nr:FAD-binding oxidoreductase [Paraburkholderia piptadeniae]SIT37192.1 FAD linked oxidase domain-containing protein [Paraburkholderia piptadeniae]
MINSSEIRQSGFQGEIIQSGDQEYDKARAVFNASIDRRPVLIARCVDADDVARIVTLARRHNLPLAIRSTGHNVAGYAVCDDGVVIDLSLMKAITVDPSARTVRVESGCNWGDVNDALQLHGLAATGGFVSITGVSGLTLGGGLGWLVRKHGLALDNLLGAEIVLADGRKVKANSRENEDLFWAIRGGGGNFGVVTSFEFQAHPAGTVLAGIVLHPASAAASAIRSWRDLEAEAPDESTLGALLFHMPDDPSLPPPMRGAPVAGLGGVYAGPVEEGEKVLQRLREYGPPLVDKFAPTPYNEAQRMADFLWPPGLHGYWKSSYLKALDDAAVDIVVDRFARVPSRQTVIVLENYGNSAWSRVPESATAFGHRNWPWNIVVTSAWSDAKDSERNIAWTRELLDALRPYTAPGAYVNYLGGDEGVDGLQAAYGTKLGRLASIKAKYDPTNLFRLNQNIAPEPGG